jgi:hypothetical protein
MSPLKNVSRFAIWKKNGRLSVGGEMSAVCSATASAGPPGLVRSAKTLSDAISSSSTGVNP